MNEYQLISDNLEPVTFQASNSQLSRRLHAAYIEFKNKHGLNHALLYVRHSIHGWRQVIDASGGFKRINNPLTLDYEELIFAVIHTLSESDRLHTAEQREEVREKKRQEERNMNAEIKRRSFHIIKP
ncbi:hypothetical protein MNBD_GAMMA09-1406 [hydrothermal vent metagenome]|uniref:Uncharacterized protein n=1 Tax=hydrothermal vent metagenome TaxID=652676 RepID=A0A3B0WXD8_9ZZZZ